MLARNMDTILESNRQRIVLFLKKLLWKQYLTPSDIDRFNFGLVTYWSPHAYICLIVYLSPLNIDSFSLRFISLKHN